MNEDRDDPAAADPGHDADPGHETTPGHETGPGEAPTDDAPTPNGPDDAPAGPERPSADPDRGSTGPGQPIDIDTEFAAIVARWSVEDTGAHPWPAAEDVSSDEDPANPRALPDRAEPPPAPGRDRATVDPLIPPAWTQVPPEVEEERFVPPDPPPLRGGDLVFRLAWAGVLGGPLFILATVVLTPEISRFWLFLAVLAFLAGFVTLVARLPRDRGDDDDGAVV